MTQLTITTVLRLEADGNIVESHAHKKEQLLYNVEADGDLLTFEDKIQHYTRSEALKKAQLFKKGKVVKSTA